MILSIGIDSVEIERFSDWANYSIESLQKTLNKQEINYCLENKIKTPERFAARFAVKEAFFKAFCQAFLDIETPAFLTICQNIYVINEDNGRPKLQVNWPNIIGIQRDTAGNSTIFNTPKIHVSITHTKYTATAMIILESEKTA